MILIKCPYCGEREQSEFTKLLEANQINVTHKTIISTKGHDCFLLEPDLFEKELGKFI